MLVRVLRATLIALLVVAGAAAVTAATGGGERRAGDHTPTRARRTVPLSWDGLNDTLVRGAQWAAAVDHERAAAQARETAGRARDSAAARTTTRASGTRRAGGVDWDGIARCETGGNWQHQTRYDGGLGILHAAWTEFGGRDFAEYGSQATREQQIVVAERIYARYGLSGWGCRAYG